MVNKFLLIVPECTYSESLFPSLAKKSHSDREGWANPSAPPENRGFRARCSGE